jgi:dimethylamine--corrinoid protein Co-methyltransferase
MSLCHALASGMGGIRTAGDLVARMQLRKMRLPQAKRFVADRLGVSVDDLTDSTLLRELRAELDIGVVTGVPHAAKGIAAKARIADLLEVRIPCVDRLWQTAGRPPRRWSGQGVEQPPEEQPPGQKAGRPPEEQPPGQETKRPRDRAAGRPPEDERRPAAGAAGPGPAGARR